MNHSFADEDIIRFIRGEMSEVELKAFEKELVSNRILVDEVRNVRLAISVIDRKGEQLLKKRFEKLERRNTIKKGVYILLTVITVLVLGLVLKKGITKEKKVDPKAIYAEHFQKYRSPVTIRNADSPQSDMSAAIKAYGDEKYDEAFDLFNTDCSEINQEACFYAILSAIYDGKIDFRGSKNTLMENSPYAAIVMWNEALFYLKQNNKNEAIKLFKELSEMGTYKKIESLAILKRLRLLEK